MSDHSPQAVDFAAVEQYLRQHFLPTQRRLFLDSEQGGFYERTDASGHADVSVSRRLLSQCRQVFQFSYAFRLFGDDWMQQTATHGFEYLKGYQDQEYGGWFFSRDPAGNIADDRKDLYAHAFVLFALAHYYKICPGDDVRQMIRQTLSVLEDRCRDSIHGGYVESANRYWDRQPSLRLQNPHMHLLEAMLAVNELVDEVSVVDQVDRLFDLFRNKLSDSESGALGEYFDETWNVSETQGHRLEPGHHFEWSWILTQLQETRVDSDAKELAAKLFQYANLHVQLDQFSGVQDEVSRNQEVLLSSQRLWPQTELLKALCVLPQRVLGENRIQAINSLLEYLFKYYLKPDGRWIEQIEPSGNPSRTDMPATSGYHVTLAMGELLKLADPGT